MIYYLTIYNLLFFCVGIDELSFNLQSYYFLRRYAKKIHFLPFGKLFVFMSVKFNI